MNDCRNSNVQVGWYAFANGKFAPDPNVYPNLQGVVAWLNPDTDAPVGKRGLILIPDEIDGFWISEISDVGTLNPEDGKANTKKLLNWAKNHDSNMASAEWCASYANNAVKSGEGFWPAKNQLVRIAKNRVCINQALDKIGGVRLEGMIWSSTDDGLAHAWCVYAGNNTAYSYYKRVNFYVRCVLEF